MNVAPQTIVSAFKTAPGGVREGLTAPRLEMRYDAYKALGDHVYRTLFPVEQDDRDQMMLPL